MINHGWTRMNTDSKTGRSKNETKRSGAADAERRRASWSAAGSAAPRRFRRGGTDVMFAALRARESGVAAALGHRSPRRARPAGRRWQSAWREEEAGCDSRAGAEMIFNHGWPQIPSPCKNLRLTRWVNR